MGDIKKAERLNETEKGDKIELKSFDPLHKMNLSWSHVNVRAFAWF